MCDPPRIYPSLPEYIPPFNNYNIMRPSQNLLLPPRIYPPFQQIYMCDPSRIYSSLPEYTPLFNKCIHVTLTLSTPSSQNIPSFFLRRSHEYIPPSQEIYPRFSNYVRHSQKLPLPPRIHPLFDNLMPPPAQNISLLIFLQLYAIFQESTP